MKAFGLSDMTYAKALHAQGADRRCRRHKSFANKLSDTALSGVRRGLQLRALGDKRPRPHAATTGTVDQYVRQTLEENAGDQNEGVRLALYFSARRSTITTPIRFSPTRRS